VSVFSSVSQSLRTGEPLHTVLPQTLLDRLLIHHQLGEFATLATPDLDSRSEIGPDEMQSINHMFYTSAVVAVYQLMQVRIREVPITMSMFNGAVCSAWTNFMLSLADSAGRFLSVVSRDGCTNTSRGGELCKLPSHERPPLLPVTENRSS
jgi:hypothetical protein